MRRLLRFLAAVIAAQPALADEPVIAAQGLARVALLDGWRQPDGSRMAAIEITLAPGWHTYWRVPGAVGIPPEFEWSQSRNLASVTYEWPRPVIFDNAGLPGIGYAGQLVLPILLTPTAADQPIDLSLDLFFGVCRDICVPAEARLTGHLAPDAAPAAAERIKAALAERPRSAKEAGVTTVTCALAPAEKGYELTTKVTFGRQPEPEPGQIVVIESGLPGVWIGPPVSETVGRTITSRAPLEPAAGGAAVLDRGGLRLTLVDSAGTVDIRGCAAPG
ncbi:protein-disulfide reductase DsbD domain-containing protein [Amaricoccus sp.]|uniref:protein-disulfide reductase DsbD domain-containing protein n=1 Tax=Amaricoccus sp. TaxID=1872485 RepID=UPI00262B5071|nr:protein-disulfide reductase DsbD domain-containing protein [uncultured Amaricoccus sp.]